MASMRIGFAGTPEFSAAHLKAILERSTHQVVAVWTQPDRPAGRGKQPAASPVKLLANEHNLPVYQPLRLDESAQADMREQNLDLLVVVAYGLLLPQAVLDTPTYGCINVHASLLPRWRGAAPIQRCIEAGDRLSGACIMQMDAGLDTGPVLARTEFELALRETAGSLHDRLIETGAPLLLSTLDQISARTAVAVGQEEQGSTYARKISKAEAEINWSMPADEIERKIRAFNPVPVCFTRLGEQTIRVWQAETLATNTSSAPGAILQLHSHGIQVAASEGSLLIRKLQIPGKKPLEASELLRGQALLFQPGTRLGDASAAAM